MSLHIAFLHNLQTSLVPEQAEFDTPDTVEAIRAALVELGHRVTLVEASCAASRLVTRLENLKPDIVLNTAEGSKGRCREAFYPGLLEQLEIPYTGSDAYVCTLTLDKHLSKLAVAEHGVRVPAWRFVLKESQLADLDLQYPLMVKPNFEGSSKGVTQDSVVRNFEQLTARVTQALKDYPSGLLVEEFIEGFDVTVPYLATTGVLEPARYRFGGEEREFSIYDYELKQHRPDDVEVLLPADLEAHTRTQVMEDTLTCVQALDLKDFARVDFRVDGQGRAYFIEVNALPSLEPGATIYRAAERAGLTTVASVLEAILSSARRRYRLNPPPRAKAPVVGLAYNLKRRRPDAENDSDAEFDSEETIEALAQAIASNGCEVRKLEATADLPSRLDGVDLVFNIAEGLSGRNREAQVPALLELMGLPFTGSDSAALAVTLDKGLAKRLVRQAGFWTPNFVVLKTGNEKLPQDLTFPVFIKPLAEGSSKGIKANVGVVRDEDQLRLVARALIDEYRQPALVEEFLPGREFTVGLLGTQKLRMLPPMEVLFGEENTSKIYAYEHKLEDSNMVSFQVPAEVSPALFRQLEKAAKGAFRALGCRDYARIDLRLDAQDRVNFIECNPLPGLTPDFSDMCVIARAAGMTYKELVGELLTPALRRWKLAKAQGEQV